MQLNKHDLFKNSPVDKEKFISHYWHKRPLLIKNAISMEGFSGVFPDKRKLIELSCNEDIQSRIVFKHSESEYDVEYGPFIENEFSEISDTTWNLLVSDIDKWFPESRQILKYFDFIRNWIFDDIMLSCGSKGGTVGPHTDHYDVFLLQVCGQRIWKYNTDITLNPPLIEGSELKLMSCFASNEEYNLEPGDILYLPPEIPHYGIINSDDCITCSIGMRTPSYSELMVSFVDSLAQNIPGDKRFIEPEFKTPPSVGQIKSQDIETVRQILEQTLSPNNKDLLNWFGKYITEYRSLFYEFNPPIESGPFNPEEELKLNPMSKACYYPDNKNAHLFMNGESVGVSIELAQYICDKKRIPHSFFSKLSDSEHQLLQRLFSEGSLIQD